MPSTFWISNHNVVCNGDCLGVSSLIIFLKEETGGIRYHKLKHALHDLGLFHAKERSDRVELQAWQCKAFSWESVVILLLRGKCVSAKIL